MHRLPFERQWSAGLGVVTASYFEELASSGDATDKSSQQKCLQSVETHFPQVNLNDGLKKSWTLWNAFEAAISSAPSGLIRPEQKKTWLETGVWFKARRLD